MIIDIHAHYIPKRLYERFDTEAAKFPNYQCSCLLAQLSSDAKNNYEDAKCENLFERGPAEPTQV